MTLKYRNKKKVDMAKMGQIKYYLKTTALTTDHRPQGQRGELWGKSTLILGLEFQPYFRVRVTVPTLL